MNVWFNASFAFYGDRTRLGIHRLDRHTVDHLPVLSVDNNIPNLRFCLLCVPVALEYLIDLIVVNPVLPITKSDSMAIAVK